MSNWALILGASSGIGASCARELAEKGVNIYGIYLRKKSNVIVKPADEDTGIVFIRTDIKENNKIIALWSNVCSTKLCTTISNDYNISVSTIEHLMSALSGMHIDNAVIEIDGPEVPIMDGSAKPIV